MTYGKMPVWAGVIALATVAVGAAHAGSGEDEIIVYDAREASTAVTALSVVSPENLFVWNSPSLVSSHEVVYSAKQWIDEKLTDTVSVWRNRATGGAATKVVPAGDREFLWSAAADPDSDRLYFTHDCNVYSTGKTGVGGRKKHTSSGYCDYGAVPIPATGKLLFSTCNEGRDCFTKDSNYIWVVNEDGSELVQLRQGATPSISRDGQTIVFSYEGDIWTMGVDGTNVTNLTQSADFHDVSPRFSPDGWRIVFQRSDLRDGVRTNPDIWVVDVSGTNTIQLTQNAAYDWGPYWAQDGFVYFVTNRGPLIGNVNPRRVWRMKLAE